MKTKKSQNKLILEHLRMRGTITPLEALHFYGCMRLASRINVLRNQGQEIETNMIKDKGGKRYAQYELI